MIRQLALLSALRAVLALGIAIVYIVVARQIGPASFGVFAALVAVQQVLFGLTTLNAAGFVAREQALGHTDRVRAALVLNALLLGASTTIFLGISVAATSGEILLALLATGIAGMLDGVGDVRVSVAVSRREILGPATSLGVRAALLLGLFWTLSLSGTGALVALVLARITASLTGLLVAAWRIRVGGASRAPLASTVKRMLPLWGSAAVSSLRGLDATLVTVCAGAAAGGVYSAASRMLAPAGVFAAAASSVAMGPAATADNDAVRRRYDHVSLAICGLTLATLAVVPFSEQLVTALFGPAFAGGGVVFALIMLRFGVLALGPVQTTLLQSRHLDRLVLINTVAVTALSLLAVSIGAVLLGAAGAAGAYATVTVLGFLRLWAVGRRRLSADPPL